MPEIAGLIAAIASLAGTGVGLGETLANQPGTPKAVTPSPSTTDASAIQNAQNTKAVLSQSFPTLQQATGGALSPETWVQLSQVINNLQNNPQASGVAPNLISQLTSGSGGSTVQAGSVGTTPSATGLTSSTFG